MTKSVNASEKRLENKTESPQKKQAIGSVLRNGLLVGVGAGMLLTTPTAKAQLETNTVTLNQTSLSLDWQPEASGGNFVNGNGSQSISAFNPSLGTLEAIDLSLTISYTVNDSIRSVGGVNQGQDVISLSPILSSPFYTGSLYTGVTTIGGNSAALPNAVFTYNDSDNYNPLGGQYGDNQSLSGTLTYNLSFTSPLQLDAFLSSGNILEGLASSSTPSPDAPFQVYSPDNSGNYGSIVTANETINGTETEIYSTPEPSTIALAGLAGLSALIMLRRRRD